MANITDLTELNAAPASGDVLLITDISDTTQAASGTSKYVTTANLRAIGSELAAGYVHVDNYGDDIAAALTAATAAGVGVVRLNPATTYQISKLTIPTNVSIEGIGPDHNIGGTARATIEATGAITMIEMGGQNAALRNVYIDGGALATTGVYFNAQSFCNMEGVSFANFPASSTALKFTQSLYPVLRNVIFLGSVNDTQIDASDVGGSYYGINDGIFEHVKCQGDGAALILNGKLTAINFNVENTNTLSAGNIEVSPTGVQSELTLISPYYEGNSSANGTLNIKGGSKVFVYGGQFRADSAAGGVFCSATSPEALVLRAHVEDYAVGLTGTVAASTLLCDVACTWNNVTAPTSGFTVTGATSASGLFANPGGYTHTLGGGLKGAAYLFNIDTTNQLNLALGNVFRCYSATATPKTIRPTGAKADIFAIYAVDGNVTLEHGTSSARFFMQKGANLTLSAGDCIQFAIDDTNVPREIGDASIRF